MRGNLFSRPLNVGVAGGGLGDLGCGVSGEIGWCRLDTRSVMAPDRVSEWTCHTPPGEIGEQGETKDSWMDRESSSVRDSNWLANSFALKFVFKG